ncbi:hypothetical protein [Bradyrhizobium pachyrhizi]|uniref:hypothetical protein n=1 Tax=Bradyrhizobium pachyrhizi TaxID=280333 RepID=UPI00067B7ED2|nr:hypothetical protein [Bradyrhizobium pachyrhizi]
MIEPISILVEDAIQIAWDFLERSGEIGDPYTAGRFLTKIIDEMAGNGEHRKIMLANRAIEVYRRHRRAVAA